MCECQVDRGDFKSDNVAHLKSHVKVMNMSLIIHSQKHETQSSKKLPISHIPVGRQDGDICIKINLK
jgi:hypothetical protein